MPYLQSQAIFNVFFSLSSLKPKIPAQQMSAYTCTATTQSAHICIKRRHTTIFEWYEVTRNFSKRAALTKTWIILRVYAINFIIFLWLLLFLNFYGVCVCACFSTMHWTNWYLFILIWLSILCGAAALDCSTNGVCRNVGFLFILLFVLFVKLYKSVESSSLSNPFESQQIQFRLIYCV